MVLVADVALFDEFMKAVIRYARLKNITNAGTAISLIVEKLRQEIISLEVAPVQYIGGDHA